MFSKEFASSLNQTAIAMRQDRASGLPAVQSLAKFLEIFSNEVEKLGNISLSTSANQLTITNGMASITLSPSGAVTIKANSITITSAIDIAVAAGANLTMTTGGDLSMKAAGNLVMKGARVLQN
jgi:uncharacterized protein (DUF2345 family)